MLFTVVCELHGKMGSLNLIPGFGNSSVIMYFVSWWFSFPIYKIFAFTPYCFQNRSETLWVLREKQAQFSALSLQQWKYTFPAILLSWDLLRNCRCLINTPGGSVDVRKPQVYFHWNNNALRGFLFFYSF